MMKHNISWCDEKMGRFETPMIVPVVCDTNNYIMSNVCEGTSDRGYRRCKDDEQSVLCQIYRTTNA